MNTPTGAPAGAEPLEDLEFKREEHKLTREVGQYQDERIMRWLVFLVILGAFVGSLIGAFKGHAFSTQMLTIVGSGLVGSLLPNPVKAFWSR